MSLSLPPALQEELWPILQSAASCSSLPMSAGSSTGNKSQSGPTKKTIRKETQADLESRPKKRKQVSLACTNCRRAKTACSHKRPCDRCASNSLQCVDVPRRRRSKSQPEPVLQQQLLQHQAAAGAALDQPEGRERSNSLCSQLNQLNIFAFDPHVEFCESLMLGKLLEEPNYPQPVPLAAGQLPAAALPTQVDQFWLFDPQLQPGDGPVVGCGDEDGCCGGDNEEHDDGCLLCATKPKETIEIDEYCSQDDPFLCDVQSHYFAAQNLDSSDNPFFL